MNPKTYNLTLVSIASLGGLLVMLAIFLISGIGGATKSSSPEVNRPVVKPVKVARPTLPAPELAPMPAATPPPVLPEKPTDGLIARLLKENQLLKLTPAQLSKYLSENQGNAEALLAVFRLTGDMNSLLQAANQFPDDPQVQLQLALSSGDPSERRRGIDALRKNDPDNALGDYLSALDHFRSGRMEDALNDLVAAADKTTLDDYALSALQASEEAYMAAGYSVVEAKAAAMLGVTRQQINPLRDLSKQMSELQNRYLQMGDRTSAQTVADMGINLGQQAQDSNFLIDELAGASIEKQFLGLLDPAARQARLDEMDARKTYLQHMAGSQAWVNMDGAEAVAFFDRQKLYGELEALRWLRERHGEK
jgi:hypothetical protein